MQFTSNSFPILVIIGPSGSGKSTIANRLSEQNLVKVIPTWTTRPPRPDEQTSSIEHKFVTEAELKKAKAEGVLLATLQMFNLPYWYGAPKIAKPKQGLVPLIILRASLIDTFSKYYTNYVIYQVEDTLPRIKERLLKRGLHGEDIGSRLDSYSEEVALGRNLAQRLFINGGSTEATVKKLEQAIMEDFR